MGISRSVLFTLCACVTVCVCAHICVCTCGGQRSTLGVFLNHSSFLKQGSSVILEITDSIITDQQAPRILSLAPRHWDPRHTQPC